SKVPLVLFTSTLSIQLPRIGIYKFNGNQPFSALKTDDDSKSFNRKLEGVNLKPQAAASKSLSPSCSQSSCSSQSCSSGTQLHPQASHVAGHEDPIVRENSSDSVLERAGSDAELHMSSDEVPSSCQDPIAINLLVTTLNQMPSAHCKEYRWKLPKRHSEI
ncbi:unnamed protein product, partial [Ilex paraguariensis]